ncbi:MAG: DUF4846 domain-containing protein [Bacteroidota bacterium]|nr:DUF4846 domain-containing protein [Bacteroidota bacterium]
MTYSLLLLLPLLECCTTKTTAGDTISPQSSSALSHVTKRIVTDSTSWVYFLQHLPEKNGPVINYKGVEVGGQSKHFSIINYDVGTQDLQQCADALMRLRAEYLFAQKRFDEIGFHFVSGQYYRFTDYCKGLKPVAKGNDVKFLSSAPTEKTHQQLRKYLDFVYAYASTISLAKELKDANEFEPGTIIIHAGSPGHCFIITDEAITATGEKLYKLVEGYTPAQSIYVLQNTADPSLGYWHALKKGKIQTASYVFESYQLKKFE